MKTIDFILKEAGYTKEFLLKCRISGITNWCWWKWGIQWTDEARKFKYFQKEKEKELLNNLDLISDIHDIEFNNESGTNILNSLKNFLRANYMLTMRTIRLLHWTSFLRKLFVFSVMMISLNTIWLKYFNFTK